MAQEHPLRGVRRASRRDRSRTGHPRRFVAALATADTGEAPAPDMSCVAAVRSGAGGHEDAELAASAFEGSGARGSAIQLATSFATTPPPRSRSSRWYPAL